MRNPFRAKNFDVRFLPAALAGGVLVLWSTPTARSVAFGAPLVVLGLAVRGWAVGHLVKTVRFTVTGPYAHLRHPLYLGTACIGLGLAIMLGGWAAVVGGGAVLAWFALSYLPRKERVETSRLLARHGEAYARYRREVPALWPRPRPWRPSPDVAAGVDLSGAWRAERFDANNELGTVIAVVLAVSAVSLRAALV